MSDHHNRSSMMISEHHIFDHTVNGKKILVHYSFQFESIKGTCLHNLSLCWPNLWVFVSLTLERNKELCAHFNNSSVAWSVFLNNFLTRCAFAVHPLNKLPYGKLDSKAVGVKEGVLFLTYSSLIASSEKGRSRLQQLVQWCGADFDGLLIFDEVNTTLCMI